MTACDAGHRLVIDDAEALLAIAWRPYRRVAGWRIWASQIGANWQRIGVEASGQGDQHEEAHARTVSMVRQEGKHAVA